ncbi:segment polarity protein dishevelled homolog DVL-3-like [Sinocyclocheilus grahami]|uniref:segment polarity protein dishevelled homolog DVL-3-like n=1 Tax=Sinocyclocheilus grahami TaxID=75366 RepID=UPI0007AC7156|nr:PREDICTED: segment polarity protein dishevelled homolog DVL-3-like [Sinocyclocheilus grahami]
MAETKIIYHLDEQDTPYLIKLPIPAESVTLADLKNVLNKPNHKFFFKSMDDDFGVVKEEISDDNAKLPCFNGRVVSWLVSADGSHGSDGGSVCADSQADLPPPPERTGGIGDSRPPSFHANAAGSQDDLGNDTEPEVGPSLRRDRDRDRDRERPRRKDTHDHGGRMNGHSRPERRPEIAGYESSSTLMSSELDTTSFFDSEEEDSASRFSSSTEQSTSSRLMRRHRRRRRKPKAPRMERSSSFSSITDSTMSLNIITVTLNMEKYNFLGISIVGQSNERGDGGIYIGSIMKGGAVAADGRIEPGDMLLQVNDINFENMSNDDAVRVLREIVHKPGPITLTVAKCWDPNPRSCFTLPRIFLSGSDVVDWLYHHVEGFTDRREARKYASNLLKAGYIRHTVNKITFSEQCYYIFGDLCGNMASLTLHDHDGSSGASDQDTLAPLPHPGVAPWLLTFPYQYPIPHPYNPHPVHDPSHSVTAGGGSAGSPHSEGSRSSGSNRSGSKNNTNTAAGTQESGGRSGSGSESEKKEKAPSERSAAAPSEHSVRSSHTIRSVQSLVCGAPGLPPQSQPQTPSTAAPASPPDRDLASVPPELTASRKSFRMAMGNPSEFFVDVM